ncbi:nuclear transport factor 2 family protein [Nocardia sp. NPDC050712]|uniref:nuclear transport factor 2 family protein n=1 Tax=Nocardia sp. NPDC050712 TaxID=3155518 RepID=UPI0034106CB5
MSDITSPTTEHIEEKAEFVDYFGRGLALGNRDAFLDHFLPRIRPDARQRQPLARGSYGHAGFRRLFAATFAAVPDLHGTVHRWGPTRDGVLIEFTLSGTLGKRPVSIDVVDRIVLRDGCFVSNDTYFDPIPLVPPLLAHPFLAARLLPRLFPTHAERTADQPAGTAQLMAVGRILLALLTLTAPQRFAATLGIESTPELTYTTRVYGVRALAMGFGYLTADARERRRWRRLGLAVDVIDTASGLTQLLRRDVPVRAALPMLALTGSYAALGAAGLLGERSR